MRYIFRGFLIVFQNFKIYSDLTKNYFQSVFKLHKVELVN